MFDGLQTNATSATCRTTNSATITCATNQCTYVGSMLTNASNAGQVDYSFGAGGSGGSAGRFGLWNMYNRTPVWAILIDGGARYTYTSSTVREFRGLTTMQVNFVVGLVSDPLHIYVFDNIATVAVTGASGGVGYGLDSTSAFSATPVCSVVAPTANVFSSDCHAIRDYYPVLGSHFVAATQQGDNSNANDFNNVNSGDLQVRWMN
jgi:hypothetical protein